MLYEPEQLPALFLKAPYDYTFAIICQNALLFFAVKPLHGLRVDGLAWEAPNCRGNTEPSTLHNLDRERGNFKLFGLILALSEKV